MKIVSLRKIRFAAVPCILSIALVSGCKSREQAAIDQAKSQAASTGTAQQVQYIDANGDTSTTVVTPPVSGQTQQVSTNITPAPPGPKPKRTDPVVSAYGAAPSNLAANPGTPASTTVAPTAYDPAAPATQTGQPVNNVASAPSGPNGSTAPIDVRVPAGTSLAIRINQHISVKTSRAGDRFSGEVVEPIEVDGRVVIPKGTLVGGRIDASHRRGHFKGRSILELRLTTMELNGNRYALDTHDNVRSKKGKGRRTGAFIGGLTGAGMLIGGLASGGVGLAVGGAAGAGAGTLLAGTTGNRDIEIPAESVMRFRLADALYLQN